ncbi:MAG: hypothetical protein KC733_02565 [Candidatus Omnitrophica bacterium]|nr:hypothetical protein [Candidatus Omnitrophota bacterium]
MGYYKRIKKKPKLSSWRPRNIDILIFTVCILIGFALTIVLSTGSNIYSSIASPTENNKNSLKIIKDYISGKTISVDEKKHLKETAEKYLQKLDSPDREKIQNYAEEKKIISFE